MFPPVAETTVNTTGTVVPTRAAGGSKVIVLPDEIDAQVALLAVIVSAGLARYEFRFNVVFWFAGRVIAVALGDADLLRPETVEVGVTTAEEVEATTVTSMITV